MLVIIKPLDPVSQFTGILFFFGFFYDGLSALFFGAFLLLEGFAFKGLILLWAIFLYMTLHVAMEAASFLLEVFIEALFCLPFLGGGCINFHRNRVVLLFPKEPMSIGLPFGQLRKGLAML